MAPVPVVRRTFVFDSEALSKAVRGDRDVRAIIKAAPQLDIDILTSALTVIEAWNPQGSTHGALWDWALSRLKIVHTDDHLIALARSMLKAASLHGHEYAIDAVLAAVARSASDRGEQVTVFTSDVDDLERLLTGQPVKVEKV